MKKFHNANIVGHNGLSWFSNANKIIYLGIPKAASSSMRKAFNMNKSNVCNLNSNKLDYPVFTIIRNPIERFSAGLVEALNRDETPKHFKDYLKKINNNEEMLNSAISILEKDFIEVHTTPQIFFLNNLDGIKFNIDYILKFENIEKDFKKMCDKLNINVRLFHENKKNGNNLSLKNSFKNIISNNLDIKRKLEVLYKDDIVLYNNINYIK